MTLRRCLSPRIWSTTLRFRLGGACGTRRVVLRGVHGGNLRLVLSGGSGFACVVFLLPRWSRESHHQARCRRAWKRWAPSSRLLVLTVRTMFCVGPVRSIGGRSLAVCVRRASRNGTPRLSPCFGSRHSCTPRILAEWSSGSFVATQVNYQRAFTSQLAAESTQHASH